MPLAGRFTNARICPHCKDVVRSSTYYQKHARGQCIVPPDTHAQCEGQENNDQTEIGDSVGDGQHPSDDSVREPEFTARATTADWYLERAGVPVCKGSPATVIETVFWLMSLKHEKHIGDNAFDSLLKALKYAILPQEDNYCPPSLYICRKILGIQDIEDCEVHVCSNDCHVYKDKISRKDYKAVAEGPDPPCCPDCGETRFKKLSGGIWVPRKVRASCIVSEP